jgi:hypothetical protein
MGAESRATIERLLAEGKQKLAVVTELETRQS